MDNIDASKTIGSCIGIIASTIIKQDCTVADFSTVEVNALVIEGILKEWPELNDRMETDIVKMRNLAITARERKIAVTTAKAGVLSHLLAVKKTIVEISEGLYSNIYRSFGGLMMKNTGDMWDLII